MREALRLETDLFLTFMKIGMFTFGGAYSMISMIENYCVEEKHWITHDEMMNITVVAESTPGPIAINCATYVGYRQGGLTGAVIATLGMVSPSFILIFVLAKFLGGFLEIPAVSHAFSGVKIAVSLLIINAAIKMTVKMYSNILQVMIIILALIVMILSNVSSALLMAVSAATGIFIFVGGKREENDLR